MLLYPLPIRACVQGDALPLLLFMWKFLPACLLAYFIIVLLCWLFPVAACFQECFFLFFVVGCSTVLGSGKQVVHG